MPFGLSNARATFQKAMDITFGELINKIILVYQDDITVYSRNAKFHIQHLRQVFNKFQQFGISINPKKSIFAVDEGSLLGHVISKEGWAIDPNRVLAIQNLSLPSNKKALQSILGQINFVRRFIQDVFGIVQPITIMLQKDVPFLWIKEGKRAFKLIKLAITKVPILNNLDFSKPFIMYAYGADSSIATIVTQKNQEGEEHPIAFFSQTLHGVEKRYTFLDK